MQLKPGTFLQGDKYRIIRMLGSGGFGITYLAEHVMAKHKVCIKEFFPKEYYNRDEDSCSAKLGSEGSAEMMNIYKAKFIKEAQIIASLNHPNIIHIHDVFTENNTAYYVMEYIAGESLKDVVKLRGALPEAEAVKYIRAVSKAVEYIHERRIMHLDIKPANVMLRAEDDCPILIDFGISKHYDESSGEATSKTPVGKSRGFTPMEQYKEGGVNTFSPETDIYSLGATLYYLVTGTIPPQASDVLEDGLPALPSHLSVGVRRAITTAMQSRRKDRPKNIAEFLGLLDFVDNASEMDTYSECTIPDAVASEAIVADIKKPQPEPKESGEKSEKTKKQKSRWWIWLLILIIGGAGFYVLYERDTSANNEIWYTSINGNIVEPSNSFAFDANIVSNTYTNGKGVIKFDGDVTTIGENAFYSCNNLTSVNIPDSVTSIGRSAFWKCTSLTSVNIPDSVTSIGENAFMYCSSLTSVNIPDSVTTIGEDAFRGCTSLTSVNIPDSVTEIGENAFTGCSSLTSVNIPDSVTTIGDFAFASCSSLTSVNIPDSVTSIGSCAFDYCDSLTEFTGKFATEDGRSLIMGNTIIAYANASGTTYTIPDSVTTIGDSAFAGCDSLTSVNIPDSVTSIGSCAFDSCSNLTSVTIPDSVTTIGDYAFQDCTSLTSVNIPDSITEIGVMAFDSCNSLTSVYCKATTPPALHGTGVFYANGSGRKIYVPAGSVNAYKRATDWREDAYAIVGYDF